MRQDDMKRLRKKTDIFKSRRETWDRGFPHGPQKEPALLIQISNLPELWDKFGCLSHPVCTTLLWQPLQTNIVMKYTISRKKLNRQNQFKKEEKSQISKKLWIKLGGGDSSPKDYNFRDRFPWISKFPQNHNSHCM